MGVEDEELYAQIVTMNLMLQAVSGKQAPQRTIKMAS